MVEFEIGFYDSIEGESIFIDAIRLVKVNIAREELHQSQYKGANQVPDDSQFTVLGTDLVVKDIYELAKILEPGFKPEGWLQGAHMHESPDAKHRPAIMVVYLPKH